MKAILEANDSKYVIIKKIGNGGTCTVFKGFSLLDKSKKLYAIKIFKENAKKFFDKEILINKYLPPEYFIPIYEYGSGYIKCEASNEGNIFDTNDFSRYKKKIYYSFYNNIYININTNINNVYNKLFKIRYNRSFWNYNTKILLFCKK